MDRKAGTPWVLLLVVLIVAVVMHGCDSREARMANERADSLATEMIASRVADSLQWETRLVDATSDLRGALGRSSDSTAMLKAAKDSLIQEVESLNGRVETLVDMYAEARGQIERASATAFRTDSASVPDSIVGHVDDGTLSADVKATVEPPTVSVPNYSVRLALVLGLVNAPDGRALVTARSPNENVHLSYGDVFYSPPPPERYCSIGTKARWGLIGAGVGGAIRPVTDLIKSIFGSN